MLNSFIEQCTDPQLCKGLYCSTCLLEKTEKCKHLVKIIAPGTSYCLDYIERDDTMKEHNRRRYFFNSTTRDVIAKMYRINGSRVPNEELVLEEMGEVQQAYIKLKRSKYEMHLKKQEAEENYMEELCDVMGLCYSILANGYGVTDEEITKRIYEKHHRAYNRYLAQKSQGL